MRALGSVPRAVIAGSAFAAFGAAFAGIPLGARGAAIALPTPLPVATQRAGRPAVVLPRRDPFAGGEPPAPGEAPSPVAAPGPSALVPLPPNAGAGGVPFPFGGDSVHLRAVITGARPFALVEDGGATRLVTLGDALAGDAIAAITVAGVRLAHGRTIAVAPATPSFPAGTGGDRP